jgi:hypothetical protein
MFKDVFTLKKSAYHVKMMNYIWDMDHRDFSHMCPYFWLSVFNHFLILIVFPARQIGRLFSGLNDRLKEKARNKRYKEDSKWETKKKEFATRAKTDPDFFKSVIGKIIWNRHYADRKRGIDNVCVEKDYYNFYERLDYGWDFDSDLVEQFRKYREEVRQAQRDRYLSLLAEQEALEEKRKQLAIARKERINKINKIAKPIGKFLLGVAITATALFVLYLVYLGVVGLANLTASQWVKIGTYGGLTLIVIIGIILIVLFFKWLNTLDLSISLPGLSCEQKKAIKRFFKNAGAFLNKIGNKIGGFFALLFQMAKNECPAIKWED